MTTTLTTLLISPFLLVWYVGDSFPLTLPETQITHQSNSPKWVKLPEKEGMSVENQFFVTKDIDIELCEEAK